MFALWYLSILHSQLFKSSGDAWGLGAEVRSTPRNSPRLRRKVVKDNKLSAGDNANDRHAKCFEEPSLVPELVVRDSSRSRSPSDRSKSPVSRSESPAAEKHAPETEIQIEYPAGETGGSLNEKIDKSVTKGRDKSPTGKKDICPTSDPNQLYAANAKDGTQQSPGLRHQSPLRDRSKSPERDQQKINEREVARDQTVDKRTAVHNAKTEKERSKSPARSKPKSPGTEKNENRVKASSKNRPENRSPSPATIKKEATAGTKVNRSPNDAMPRTAEVTERISFKDKPRRGSPRRQTTPNRKAV